MNRNLKKTVSLIFALGTLILSGVTGVSNAQENVNYQLAYDCQTVKTPKAQYFLTFTPAAEGSSAQVGQGVDRGTGSMVVDTQGNISAPSNGQNYCAKLIEFMGDLPQYPDPIYRCGNQFSFKRKSKRSKYFIFEDKEQGKINLQCTEAKFQPFGETGTALVSIEGVIYYSFDTGVQGRGVYMILNTINAIQRVELDWKNDVIGESLLAIAYNPDVNNREYKLTGYYKKKNPNENADRKIFIVTKIHY
jgi:hypothetical protein